MIQIFREKVYALNSPVNCYISRLPAFSGLNEFLRHHCLAFGRQAARQPSCGIAFTGVRMYAANKYYFAHCDFLRMKYTGLYVNAARPSERNGYEVNILVNGTDDLRPLTPVERRCRITSIGEENTFVIMPS